MRPGASRRPNQPSPATVAAMSGAVDLAALKARNDAAARAAEAPAPTSGTYVVEVTEATFQTEVLDRSFQVPVLLDMWAEWCQPCKQLSPVLERLATAANGSWILAKIDVDANQRIAQALQVQSIPAVFAVIGGQLVPGFQGALPEAQIREFVDAVLAAGQQAGLTGAPAGAEQPAEAAPPEEEEPEDPRFVAAEQALEAGNYDLAAQQYQQIVDAEPTSLAGQQAKLALGQVTLMRRLETVDQGAIARADAAPTDVDAQLAAADLLLAGNDVEGALGRLLKTVPLVRGDDRERVRQRLLEFFDLLGPDDPRVPPARRELTRALF